MALHWFLYATYPLSFILITLHKRAKISNDSSKFLTQFYGRLRFRKHLAMLLSISNLIYDIESISSVCVCVSKYTICLCGCVFVCFCTAVSDDFSYFAKSFLHFAFWAALLAQTKALAAANCR